MRTMDRRTVMYGVLDELGTLADPADRERIDGLRERLAADRIRVLVAGEAKRGKSTVVNALVGRAMLPTGVTPVTAVATVVRHGERERVIARYADGRSEERGLDELAALVTERGNPGNRLGLASVTVDLDADLLVHGVEIVDAPGTGSVHEHNTVEAERVLETMDAAVFVLTADPPMSAAERALLERVAENSVTTFVLLNKADRLSGAEREEALAFAAEHTSLAVGRDILVRPVCARAGTGDAGFAAFSRDFTDYLAGGRAGDLEESVARQAQRLIARLTDEVRLQRRVLDMRGGEAARRLETFRERLDAVAARRQDAVDLVEAEGRRLLAALNDQAEEAARGLTSRIRERIATAVDELSEPDEVEREGRDRLVELTRTVVETWRDQRRRSLEEGLSELDARLVAMLDRELAVVRDGAAELLDLDLAVPAEEGRLIEDSRFFYVFTDGAGQTELLVGAIRRHLPGAFGRRRAREHLLRETAELVPKQVGRARADLQYRLAEATRALVRAVDHRYATTIDRLVSALGAATAATENTQARTRRRELDERAATLSDMTSRLASVVALKAAASYSKS
ncbi:dynamin family protein [Actinoallomurus sp. CA-142502]|uniref:dynamin family protein n=1 Tax=Actinoallomurus sp. CA-142502 TaxID=3239885 RepID=UPI003D92ED8F